MTASQDDRIDLRLPTGADGRGCFIVFEGGEGSGKSTQAEILARLTGALMTHQPGATELGLALRSILLDGVAGEVAHRAEALLMAADRAQHVEEVILPALHSGRPVVCDRYTGSSVAYQGFARGLDPAEIAWLSNWAANGLMPDVVIYLQVGQHEAAQRTGAPRDRIEAAGSDFHLRVLDGFESQAAADASRWLVVDGSGTVDEVTLRVTEMLARRLESA
jgi:dTMP kinase